jgi:hypothetical protein
MKTKMFWIGIGAGAGLAIALYAQRAHRLALPWSAWQGVLVEFHGESDGQRLLAEAMAESKILIAGAERSLMRPPLRTHIVENILPGLAMYRVLLSEFSNDHETALAEIEPLFKAWTQALYGGMMQMINRLPWSFWVFRAGTVMRLKDFPVEIWKTVWKENNAKRVAFDNFACLYLSTLNTYGAPELTPYFCQIDDWMAEMLPPGIAFRRSQTLARGGDRCDFCYEKVN